MTSETGMDWFLASPEGVDAKADALEAAGGAARLSLFNVVRSVFDRECRAGRLSRSSVARELGVSSQAVSNLLRAPRNMTVETAAKLMFVMGAELRISEREVAKKKAHARWISNVLFVSARANEGSLHYHLNDCDFVKTKSSSSSSSPTVKIRTVQGMTFADISNAGVHDGCYERLGSKVDTFAEVSWTSGTGAQKVLEVQ